MEQDEQLAKYEKWYQTLKAGAKAKQRSQMQHHDASGGGGGTPTSSFSSIQGSGSGSLSTSSSSAGAYNSFTNSSSLHDPSASMGIGAGDPGAFGYSSGGGAARPPAHPNRRVL
jgi:hypothetical protein